MYTNVRTEQHLNYGGQEPTQQFAVCDSDTPVTLKQGQSHQTCYELVEPKHGYNNTNFEKPCLKSVHEGANNKVFVKSGNISIISLQYVRKSTATTKKVVHSQPA